MQNLSLVQAAKFLKGMTVIIKAISSGAKPEKVVDKLTKNIEKVAPDLLKPAKAKNAKAAKVEKNAKVVKPAKVAEKPVEEKKKEKKAAKAEKKAAKKVAKKNLNGKSAGEEATA